MSFKDLKRNYIVETARKLFLQNSISQVTIKDISSVSGIGEATVYRYFATKENLAIAVSLSIQNDILKIPHNLETNTGLEQIEEFFNLFRNVFAENKKYFKFIAEFDTLYLNTIKNNKEYSLSLDMFYDIFKKSYQKGLNDKTVKKVENLTLFYYTATHSLLELCKKLASTDSSLKQDKEVGKIDEIEYLISLFVSVLKA